MITSYFSYPPDHLTELRVLSFWKQEQIILAAITQALLCSRKEPDLLEVSIFVTEVTCFIILKKMRHHTLATRILISYKNILF